MTGEYVDEEYAKANPDTTVWEDEQVNPEYDPTAIEEGELKEDRMKLGSDPVDPDDDIVDDDDEPDEDDAPNIEEDDPSDMIDDEDDQEELEDEGKVDG